MEVPLYIKHKIIIKISKIKLKCQNKSNLMYLQFISQ